MENKSKEIWTRIEELHLSRLKVPGGWLVSIENSVFAPGGMYYDDNGICFYPDPNHDWLK